MNSGGKEWNGNSTLNGGGWAKSDMREWLNGEEFFAQLPHELQTAIKSVVKYSDNGYYDYYPGPATLTRTNDKIFIASSAELNSFSKNQTVEGQGEPYILFTDAMSRKLGETYWTRSTAGKQYHHSFCVIDAGGYSSTSGGGNYNSVVIYFCI